MFRSILNDTYAYLCKMHFNYSFAIFNNRIFKKQFKMKYM